ncbi:outer membrane protein assembly factor BamE [Marinimicrobium agarilyticum]|uniref:outer membrane protein assembly factor BamE n=1 Tax=Marinimicrobium agarilyticum TaxID=306546 RepID=UPI0003FB8FE4|nr:outer membrane protein assembly factor BamE [Marinimicrobium agarilyticum]
MKIASKLSLVAVLFASLTGCSYFQFPGVHKIYVQQGHIITEEMLEQLETGMTKRQVRFVLGTPLLEDEFNQDRWDYHYTLRRGDNTLRERHLTVYFEDDVMTRYEDSLPQKTEEEEAPLVPTNIEGDPLPIPSNTPVEGNEETPLPSNTDR